jgi:DNA-directed RNA polymerase specialized sigma subunit
MLVVLADNDAKASDRSFGEFPPHGSSNPSLQILKGNDLLQILAWQIEQLSPKAKKILAMYYHENFALSEIATGFGHNECQIDEIRAQTVGLLNNYVCEYIVRNAASKKP